MSQNGGDSPPNKEDVEIHYELHTMWKDIHPPTMLATISSVYIMENVVYHPFDVMRTRIQVNRQQAFNLKDLSQIIRRIGLRGLYAGFWPTTLGYLPGNAIYLFSYNIYRDRFQRINDRNTVNPSGKQALWVSFASGALADATSNIFYAPVEVVGQRLYIQDQNAKQYKNVFDAISQIKRKDGFKGFYRGFGATLMTNVPASAIWWTTYEYCKEVLSIFIHRRNEEKRIREGISEFDANANSIVGHHFAAQWGAGFIAGITMSFVTNPMDVVKTRLQTQHFENQGKQVGEPLYRNSWDALSKMLKKEGIRSLQKGVMPRMVYSAMFSSFSGLVYEWVIAFSTRKQY